MDHIIISARQIEIVEIFTERKCTTILCYFTFYFSFDSGIYLSVVSTFTGISHKNRDNMVLSDRF